MLSQFISPLLGGRWRGKRPVTLPDCDAIFLHGSEHFDIEVVGVARQQAWLRECLPHSLEPEQSHRCVATLVLEGRKSFNKNAVSVAINGQPVGYCPAYLATKYREWLHAWRLDHVQVQCRANVECVKSRFEREARYLVKLDFDLPFKMTASKSVRSLNPA